MRLTLKILGYAAAVVLLLLLGLVIHANLKIRSGEVRAADAGAPGKFLTVDGHRWHVLTKGEATADASGAPILLIHGFAIAGHSTWLPWATERLAERSLIIPDLLGYGHSERIPSPGLHYTLGSYAASLAAILDQLGVSQVDVVGHSFGGAVAARFALDYPARVRRVVFMDAGIYVEPSGGETIIHLPLGVGRAVAWHAFGAGPFSLNAINCESPPNCPWMRLAQIEGTTDTLRAMMYSHRHWPDNAALIDDIPRITTPSLVIWGAEDRIVPVAHGERLARELQSDIAIVAAARHMPYFRQPEKVAELVLGFLQAR